MGRRLEDYTADELKELDYLDVLELRKDAYARHVAAMEVPAVLADWAEKMTKRYGPLLKVWKQRLSWLEALMVVRYGEDPMQWPPSFGPDDIDRALAWHKGRRIRGNTQKGTLPRGVEYLDGDIAPQRGVVVPSVLAVIAGVGSLSLSGVSWLWTALGLTMLGAALTNFLENEIIDWFWRGRSYTPPTTMYFALYTAAPGEAGGGTEVTGGSYARVGVSQAATEFQGTGGETTATDSTGTGGATQNINAIAFPTPSANWGTASHMAVLDASTSGNMLVYGALTNAKSINNGDPAPSFPAGSFVFALD